MFCLECEDHVSNELSTNVPWIAIHQLEGRGYDVQYYEKNIWILFSLSAILFTVTYRFLRKRSKEMVAYWRQYGSFIWLYELSNKIIFLLRTVWSLDIPSDRFSGFQFDFSSTKCFMHPFLVSMMMLNFWFYFEFFIIMVTFIFDLASKSIVGAFSVVSTSSLRETFRTQPLIISFIAFLIWRRILVGHLPITGEDDVHPCLCGSSSAILSAAKI